MARMSYSQDSGYSPGTFRMDRGLYIGSMLWPLQKSLYKIHDILVLARNIDQELT